ncbi:MAG: cyclic nucleotide-binding domain-containing protein [Pseudonocardiaceae bacterium]|nr:cyclic nucleotide-binding domain-containing protein [Pseudonocardiaceae bacterium]
MMSSRGDLVTAPSCLTPAVTADWRALRTHVYEAVDGHVGEILRLLEAGCERSFWSCASYCAVEGGHISFLEGDPPVSCYLVLQGTFRVYGLTPRGREVTFWYSRPGQFLGLAEILTGGTRRCCAQAREAAAVLAFRREQFVEVAQVNPRLSYALAQHLATRQRRACEAELAVATAPVETRLARLLLLLATESDPTGDGTVINDRYSQQELADMIGASRQATNEVLNHMRRTGLIGISKGRVIFTDRNGVRVAASNC